MLNPNHSNSINFSNNKGKLTNEIKTDYDVFVATKNTCCILPRCDILQLNDFEGIFGNELYLDQLKFIILPNSIHCQYYNQCPHLDTSYKHFCDYCKNFKFKGTFIFFNLPNKCDKDFMKKHKNTEMYKDHLNDIFICSHSSADIICRLLTALNVDQETNFDLYGIGTSGECNPIIEYNLIKSVCLSDLC